MFDQREDDGVILLDAERGFPNTSATQPQLEGDIFFRKDGGRAPARPPPARPRLHGQAGGEVVPADRIVGSEVFDGQD
ncbi:hypothetical protein LWP59_24290 [Amycolatopsis acidiphila]|uniref:hypothetical protein n=1 Tax=Amycolatopsis acidiphila TaxID=715473 RepID=UPI0019B90702|nr:hypothetical protein [Amycolatopsis acidiphila]UIJ57269.1 hypothetical protein LWP59_24290 [Amycolatopsis acidiphila]GHG52345.1 hypothetical protein GCM10017788_00230 [Amycolatopsis acidiphila]